MDKQVLAVVLSFALYLLYVLLPMIPAIVIYKMFPDTKVSATGVLANLNFKTTGAFAAYVVTVFLGFFLVQNTHHLIAQVSNPVWTLNTKVKLDGQPGGGKANKGLLETLVVTLEPNSVESHGDDVTVEFTGSRKDWVKTHVKFEIPGFGYEIVKISDLVANAKVDDYELMVKTTEPITIPLDPQYTQKYSANEAEVLAPDNGTGPQPQLPGGN